MGADAVLDIHTLYQTQTHTPRAQSTPSSMDARNMNSMLSLCYAPMQRAPDAILHQDRVGHVDGRRQTAGRGLRQRNGCWDALGGRASRRPGPLRPRHQEGLRHRGQRHLPRHLVRVRARARVRVRDPT